jgi:hypothetical protein
MVDRARETGVEDGTDAPRPNQPAGTDSIEAYEDEDEDRVVLFDAENPLAWVAAARTVALDDRV